MKCPYCGEHDTKVIDTTESRGGIRRRRECKECGSRFTTHERSLAATPVLVKGNGNREEFDRDKLKRGIWVACAKRPVPASEIERLTTRVETHLQSLGRSEVSSRVVGDMVIEGLKDLDPIAYIRYAIVYLGLEDLTSVRAEIDKLLSEQQEAIQPLPVYEECETIFTEPDSPSDDPVAESTQSCSAEPLR